MEFKSDLRENLALALDTVRAHKLRSFLAVLGVMIGVMLIILVVGLVSGFRNSIVDQINSSGANSAWAWRFNQGPSNGRRPKEERLRKPLTLEDAEAIRTMCPAVKDVTVASAFGALPEKRSCRRRVPRDVSELSDGRFERDHARWAVFHGHGESSPR
jgi:ABC-type lipoprotein release transport system permease subunit